jgi:hypothetical protein
MHEIRVFDVLDFLDFGIFLFNKINVPNFHFLYFKVVKLKEFGTFIPKV